MVQYITADEYLATIGGDGGQGWEQEGTVVLHLVVPAGFASAATVAKGDAIREALRGTSHGRVDIESCEPFTDFGGSASSLRGGQWTGWASNLYYRRHDCG